MSTMTATPSRPACIGLPDLFLSTNQRDHEVAVTLCQDCPALVWCTKETAVALRDPYGPGLHGTWAGQLYNWGKRIIGRASIGNCPHCGALDGEVCTSTLGTKIGRPHRARMIGLPPCRSCGVVFIPKSANSRYCSPECVEEGRKSRERRREVAA